MLKIFLFLLSVMLTINIWGETFNEKEFIKKYNKKISDQDVEMIIQAIDTYYYMVSDWMDKKTLYKIMALESRFNHKAISPNGKDGGLFQIRKSTHDILQKKGYINEYGEYTYLYKTQNYIKTYLFVPRFKTNFVEDIYWKKYHNPYYNTYCAMVLLNINKDYAKKLFKYKNKEEFVNIILILYNRGITRVYNEYKQFGFIDIENNNYLKSISKFN